MKNFKAIFILVAICLVTTSHAEEIDNTNWKPALKYRPFTVPEKSALRKNGRLAHCAEMVMHALEILQSYPPEGDHLFNWTGKRDVLAGKKMEIQLVSKKDDLGQLTVDARVFEFGLGLAFTSGIQQKDKNDLLILLHVYPETLLFEGIAEREDGIWRTTLALATEIYGNVQYLMELPAEKFAALKNESEQDELKRILAATERGEVAFLKRMQAADNYKKLSGYQRKLLEDVAKSNVEATMLLKKKIKN